MKKLALLCLTLAFGLAVSSSASTQSEPVASEPAAEVVFTGTVVAFHAGFVENFYAMNVRIADPEDSLVLNVQSLGESVVWSVPADALDGLYRYEVVVVTQDPNAEGGAEEGAWEGLIREHGSFLLEGGSIVPPQEEESLVAPVVVFTDVTVLAGINYKQHSLTFDEPLIDLYSMSGGAADGDFDGDWNVDLYVTRLDAPDILYRNKGDGTFEDVTATSGIDRGFGSNGAGWADIDNDGDLDLYVTSMSDSRFYLYINNWDGTFTEDAVARGAAIEGPDEHVGYSVTFGDYDNDGYLDIHTTEWRPDEFNPTMMLSNSRLLRNLGGNKAGYFGDVTESAGVAIDDVVGTRSGSFSFASRFSDLDGDGFLDLAIVSDYEGSRLFWKNGDGTFPDGTAAAGVGTDENGMGSAIGDVNGDGWLDWFVTSIFPPDGPCDDPACFSAVTGNRLYLNNGDRTFIDVTDAAGVRNGQWGWGATFIDYDNDGDLDLVMTNGVVFSYMHMTNPYITDPMRFWENDGNGHFTEVSARIGITNTGSGKGILKFDYDNDGDLDLFVVNNGGSPVLYRNDGGNSNDWLRITTFGTQPSIGAKIWVQVEQDGPIQVWEVHAGSNFLGQDEVTAHFGLGEGTDPVNLIEIQWPNGEVQLLEDVARNTTLAIRCGAQRYRRSRPRGPTVHCIR